MPVQLILPKRQGTEQSRTSAQSRSNDEIVEGAVEFGDAEVVVVEFFEPAADEGQDVLLAHDAAAEDDAFRAEAEREIHQSVSHDVGDFLPGGMIGRQRVRFDAPA